MAHKKIHLDSKICVICDKTFAWRKKWQDCWDEVKYCSERCRRNKHTGHNKSALNMAKQNTVNQKKTIRTKL